MKSSRVIPKLGSGFVACALGSTLILFVACATTTAPDPNRLAETKKIPESNTQATLRLSLNEERKSISKKEFESPLDPKIKWELAQLEWCRGARGSAVENWNWILQFAPISEWADRAKQVTGLVKTSREPEIRAILSCEEHSAKK